MLHMSQEHVDAMNALLRESEEVRAACRALPAPRTWSYRLADGPDGRDVDWTVRFADTVEFGLVPPEGRADVVFTGDWARMMRTTKASREGRQEDPGVTVTGDRAVVAETQAVLKVARAVATLPVEFPDV
jgi:hypothetical protein